ncbi:MAG: HAD family hydrolase [Planctomycetota bacterium JB042]
MTVRGLVFDLDGTLVDTLGTIAAALNHGLGVLGLPTHPNRAVATMVGEGVRVLCRKALPDARRDDESLLERLLVETRAFYDANVLLGARPYDGVEAMLRTLVEEGARLAVLSNKPDPLTVATMEGLGWAGLFEVVLGHREEFPRKPDPTSVRWILDRIGLAPAETLYVGDTPIDMRTARAASIPSIAVTWGFRGRAELEAERPDHLVDRAEEIVRLAGATAP